jgi:ABC-2 type transport system permease protein
MSAAVTAAPAFRLPAPSNTPPPLGRLVRVELRKLVDTRSGFWLLAAAVVGTALTVAIYSLVADPGDRTLHGTFEVALWPMGTLLPVVAILTMTAEFSQRTGLSTFVWIPDRMRVVQAKALAILALGLTGTLVCLLLGAIANAITPILADADGSWSLPLGDFGQGLLWKELGMLIGFGFGMLFANPGAAISTYFIVPIAFSALSAISALEETWKWIDSGTAWGPLVEMDAHGIDWAHIASSTAIWVGVPVALGLWLLRRREIS